MAMSTMYFYARLAPKNAQPGKGGGGMGECDQNTLYASMEFLKISIFKLQ